MSEKILQLYSGIDTNELVALDAALNSLHKGDVLVLDFCNGGGSVFHGTAMADKLMQATANGIKTVARVWGYAASAACLVALSCDVVEMSPNAALMYHSAWCEEGDDDSAIPLANSIQETILSKRIAKVSPKDFDGEAHWITASTALELGIIDSVIGNAPSSEDLQDIRVAASFIHKVGGLKMKKTEKLNAEVEAVKAEAPCMENEEEKKNEEAKAAEDAGDASAVDVLEQMAARLEKIEERLAVLEGEGKKADDEAEDAAESGDQIAARLNNLYARLSGGKADEKPVVAPACGGKVSKKAKIEASFERSKKIDLKSFM